MLALMLFLLFQYCYLFYVCILFYFSFCILSFICFKKKKLWGTFQYFKIGNYQVILNKCLDCLDSRTNLVQLLSGL